MERRRERNKGDEREREIDRQTELKGENNELILFVCFFLKKNWPTPASFSFIFGLFKQTSQFLQQINVKNVQSVYGAGNRTHDLWNMSLFP